MPSAFPNLFRHNVNMIGASFGKWKLRGIKLLLRFGCFGCGIRFIGRNDLNGRFRCQLQIKILSIVNVGSHDFSSGLDVLSDSWWICKAGRQ